jgi:hypothetical protein
VNLVGHVAVAVRRGPPGSAAYLAGSMLPDLAAMARVRLGPTVGDLGAGVAVHHATDAVFHSSPWFNDRSQALRDELLDAGVDRGAARACAHAGLEMLLDGALVTDARVRRASDDAFGILVEPGATRDAVHALAGDTERARWAERLQLIGTTIDVDAYRSAESIAHRLHRMTSGRARIELRASQVATVAQVLERSRPEVVADADGVLTRVVDAV